MAHDVFVSYSREDKAVADAVCATLESHRIRCWIAPRDVIPGAVWSESIIDAIDASKVMVLILSDHSNQSRQVVQEVERAVARAAAILPVRIQDVQPSRALELFVMGRHWLDAITPPLERHLERLAGVVEALLRPPDADVPQQPIATPRPSVRFGGALGTAVRTRVWAAVAIGGVVLATAVGLLVNRGATPSQPAGAVATPSAPVPGLSPGASPAADSTRVVLTDDFSSEARSQITFRPVAGETAYEYLDGELRLQIVGTRKGLTMVAALPISAQDIVIAVDVRLVGDVADRSVALACRRTGGRYLRANLSLARGNVSIDRGNASGAGSNIPVTLVALPSLAIQRDNGTNRFELACIGNRIAASVNGQEVVAAIDADPQPGAIDFYITELSSLSASLPMDARFDNLRVTIPPAGTASGVVPTPPATPARPATATVVRTAAPLVRGAYLTAASVSDVRATTGVRELRRLEEGLPLAQLPAGVFGFTVPWLLNSDSTGVVGGTGVDKITLGVAGGTAVMEVHKSILGDVYVVGYFPTEVAGLLVGGITGTLPATLAFSNLGGHVVVAVPVERIVSWQFRSTSLGSLADVTLR